MPEDQRKVEKVQSEMLDNVEHGFCELKVKRWRLKLNNRAGICNKEGEGSSHNGSTGCCHLYTCVWQL
jgi:hypothetical protein